MAVAIRLVLQCLNQPRMVMAKGSHPPGGVGIDQPAAVDVPEVGALRPRHDDRIDLGAVAIHWRVGVPHALLVECNDAIPIHGFSESSSARAAGLEQVLCQNFEQLRLSAADQHVRDR